MRVFFSDKEWFIVVETSQDISEHFTDLTIHTSTEEAKTLWQGVYDAKTEEEENIELRKVRNKMYTGWSCLGITTVICESEPISSISILENYLKEEPNIIEEEIRSVNNADVISCLLKDVMKCVYTKLWQKQLYIKCYRVSPMKSVSNTRDTDHGFFKGHISISYDDMGACVKSEYTSFT